MCIDGYLTLFLSRGILDDSAFTKSFIPLASKPITYQHQQTDSSHCSSFPSSLSPAPCNTSSHPAPQPQALLSGTEAEQREQHHPMDKGRTAGCLGNVHQMQDTLLTERVPADLSEDVLLKTLQNLMMEAVRGELVLTAHPSPVILPPVSTR